MYFWLSVNNLCEFVCDCTASCVPSGAPVIVGMSINIASIDSISEVNMVSYKTFSYSSTVHTEHQLNVSILIYKGTVMNTQEKEV